MATTITITAALINEIAIEAVATPHSVKQRLLGLEVRGRVGQRVDAALASHGLRPGALNVRVKATRSS